jgi:hypothetical protein
MNHLAVLRLGESFAVEIQASAQRVGQSTDASEIIAEVKKTCTARPTMRLREATAEAYGNIWDREAKRRERK